MRHAARRALLATVVVTATAAAVPLLATATAAAAPPTGVAVLVVPDLRWSDLAAMPTLHAFEDRAAVAVLSVRSEGSVTRCGDGLLEISAGTRVPSGLSSCAPTAATVSARRDGARHSRYGARIGLLGDALRAHAVAIDPAAGVIVADSSGVGRRAASIAGAFAADPAAIVVAVDDQLYVEPDRGRAAAAADAALAQQLAAVPPGTTVMVVGCSDGPRGGPHLHPLLVAGAAWPHRVLTSASAGRPPYVQLFDVTATVLALGHAAVPESVSGRAVHVGGGAPRSAAAYVDVDRHARRALSVGHPTFTALSAILIGCLLLAVAGRREASWVARLLVFAPVATWLVQLMPWWRWSTWAYAGAVAGVAVAGAVVVAAAGRRSVAAAIVVGPAVTAAVLVGDQLAGAPLQLSAPFGDNPLVAGRFHGMGNIDFAVTAVSLLLCAAWVAAVGRRGTAVVGAVVLCFTAIVVDGLPQLGDDVGGVLALVPAVAVLLALVLGVRITWTRAVGVAGVAVAVAAAAAIADYQRPAAAQTHAGRFVGQVLHGGAWRVVHRKLDAVAASVDNPVVTVLVAAALAAAVVASRSMRTSAPVRAGAAAVAVVAVVGSLLNDSGVFVAAAAFLAGAPAALAWAPARPARSDNRLS